MARQSTLWIVLADGEHARAVSPNAEHALLTVWSLNSFAAHRRSSDLGSDAPGRSFESSGTLRHAVSPRHDPHEMEKQHFAEAVGQQLNDLSGHDMFEQLVVVAPPDTLSAVREALDVTTQAKLIGTLHKDLLKVPDEDLPPHLTEWVKPLRRESW